MPKFGSNSEGGFSSSANGGNSAPSSNATVLMNVSASSGGSSNTGTMISSSSDTAASHAYVPLTRKGPRGPTCITYLAKAITYGTIILSVIGIIGYSVDLYRHGRNRHFIGWFSSAGFVILTVFISVNLIVQHLTHWIAPHIQKYVVRIIWMIPIYSVESWLALRFKSLAIYIETIRECYESYVIFSFLYFLIALLGEEQQLIHKLKEKSPSFGRHSWPVSLFVPPWIMGQELLQKCKFGVFQYVLIKTFFAILVCILQSRGLYHEGKFQFDGMYLYQCFICNISQIWALYCLVLFYFATKDELGPYRPVGKFLSVKTLVFFTWWQSIMINILGATNLGLLSGGSGAGDGSEGSSWTVSEISKGVQDYLITIEMFFASIAFNYTFSYRDYIQVKMKEDDDKDNDDYYVEESKPFLSAESISALWQSSIPDDIFADFRRFAKHSIMRKNSVDSVDLELAAVEASSVEAVMVGSSGVDDLETVNSTSINTSQRGVITDQAIGADHKDEPSDVRGSLGTPNSGSSRPSSLNISKGTLHISGSNGTTTKSTSSGSGAITIGGLNAKGSSTGNKSSSISNSSGGALMYGGIGIGNMTFSNSPVAALFSLGSNTPSTEQTSKIIESNLSGKQMELVSEANTLQSEGVDETAADTAKEHGYAAQSSADDAEIDEAVSSR